MKKIIRIVNRIAIKFGYLFPDIYFIFSKAFKSEHYSVLKGISAHKRRDTNSIAVCSSLRRNIHRIEKGLTTPNGKEVFGENYINKLVNDLSYYIQTNPEDINTIKWCKNVLDEYYMKVKKTPAISKSFNKFSSLNFPYFSKEISFNPTHYSSIQKSNISYSSFEKLCFQRHGIRWYENKPVERSLIDDCIKLALQSPSACNRQPYRFIIVDDPQKVRKLSKLPMGANSFSDNIPVFIFLIGNLSAYEDPRDRHLIYIDGGLAAMTFVLSLETVGLSSCIINWPAIPKREKELRKNIQIREYEQCIMCISVGYPKKDIRIPFSAKKTVEDVTSYLD